MYYPVLLSKESERIALKNLNPSTKSQICPIIQVLSENKDALETLLLTDWNFNNNKVLLDFSLYANLATNINEVETLFRNLIIGGINAIPVIQYNSPTEYYNLLNRLILDFNCNVCMRASNNSGGFINYSTQLAQMQISLNLVANEVLLLLDFGYVNSNNYQNNAAIAINILQNLPTHQEWKHIIIASGSFPENLGALSANNLHLLKRYEWNLWLAVRNAGNFNIGYSDYGTKYPFNSNVNFQGSCSIKYTTTDNYVIYRGELSQNHRDGNGQYITYSNQLINSAHYSGATFSWGDNRIEFIANQNINNTKRQTGNAGSWVQISQNHHLTLLESIL